MKINAIKKLAETQSLEDLQQAEMQIIEEIEPSIPVDGIDDGEKLTHVIGAIWVIKELEKGEMSLKDAVRAYTQKVRNSIS